MTADGEADGVKAADLTAQRERLGGRIERAIARVLEHGQFVMGPEVYELEQQLAEYCGVRHAVTCASGTDALLLCLLAKEVGPGDGVFLPTFTFVATAEVVSLLGATPVFVDVGTDTFNIDMTSLKRAVDATVQEGRLRCAGIIAVDLFGHPADYRAVEEVAATHRMWVLADAAQSFGATYHGRRVGTLAELTATSFFPAKPFGCYGDGGAVLTDDAALAGSLRSLRVHGQGADKYENVRVGINGRLDTIQAAVLLAKLSILDAERAERQGIAERYSAALGGAVEVPRVVRGVESAWAQYTVRVPRRDEVAARLRAAGIPAPVYYPTPLHRQPVYRSAQPVVPMGVSEALAASVLSLPIHPYLPAAAEARVASLVAEIVSDLRQG